MDLTQILTIVLAAILGPGVAAYIALRKLPTEQKAAEVDVQAAYMEMAAKVPEIYEGIFEDFRADLTAQEKRIDELERGREADAILIGEQAKRIDDLERQLKVALGTIAALTESNESLLRERGELADELATLKKIAGDLKARMEVLEAENRELRQERDQLLKRPPPDG